MILGSRIYCVLYDYVCAKTTRKLHKNSYRFILPKPQNSPNHSTSSDAALDVHAQDLPPHNSGTSSSDSHGINVNDNVFLEEDDDMDQQPQNDQQSDDIDHHFIERMDLNDARGACICPWYETAICCR